MRAIFVVAAFLVPACSSVPEQASFYGIHMMSPGESAESDAAFMRVRNEYHDAGGLEINDAGFHQFPADHFSYTTSAPAVFHRFKSGALNNVIVPFVSPYSTHVKMEQEEVLTLGVATVRIVNSAAHQGLSDVVVTFTKAVRPYAERIQNVNDTLEAQGALPENRGVGLIYNNFLYRWFSYGDIVISMDSGTPLTVAEGVDAATASSIQDTLNPD